MNDDLETVFPLPFWFILVAALLFGCPTSVSAEPKFQTFTDDGAVITLYSDKCELKEVVNLPYRVTWVEKGKTTEGCYGAKQNIVIFYFLDKTVGVIPVYVFQPVTGA